MKEDVILLLENQRRAVIEKRFKEKFGPDTETLELGTDEALLYLTKEIAKTMEGRFESTVSYKNPF